MSSWWKQKKKSSSQDEKRLKLARKQKQLRTELMIEQRRLTQAVQALLQSSEEELRTLAERVQRVADADISREAPQIIAAQRALDVRVMRMQLAQRETRSLLDEWHDWQRYTCVEDEALRRLQQELVRSELAVRGVTVLTNVSITEEEEQENARPAAPLIARIDVRSMRWDLDHEAALNEAWRKKIEQPLQQSVAYWEARAREFLVDRSGPSITAARTFAALRTAHALQRGHDKTQGRTRERVAGLITAL